ncbi:hypothetical protein [Pseudobutyrivibrio sp.]|uniref:hypothetical protein n=1 Tax=Pseudobutyrivibrio sp. TaxID=2014367 RepID=UPI00386BA358
MATTNLYTIEKELKLTSIVRITELIKAIENSIESIDSDDDYYEADDDFITKLHSIIGQFDNADIDIDGFDDDYHNLSVLLAKEGKYSYACSVLKRGLSEWEKSIDLLADYLNYSRFCNKTVFDKCDDYYRVLCTIPQKEWNWRAFSFSLDYLMAKKKQRLKEDEIIIIDNILRSLSYDFCCQEDNDLSYFDRYTVLDALGEKDAAYSALQDGVRLKAAPKCCLKMADIEFEKGNYRDANSYLERCLNVLPVQQSINKGYASLLLALSKTSLFMENKSDFKDIDNQTRAEVEELYKSFDTAVSTKELTKAWKNTADRVISVLEAQTGIKKEEDSDELY